MVQRLHALDKSILHEDLTNSMYCAAKSNTTNISYSRRVYKKIYWTPIFPTRNNGTREKSNSNLEAWSRQSNGGHKTNDKKVFIVTSHINVCWERERLWYIHIHTQPIYIFSFCFISGSNICWGYIEGHFSVNLYGLLNKIHHFNVFDSLSKLTWYISDLSRTKQISVEAFIGPNSSTSHI